MKKGFTLIELLAVIVILAIIALIAVPIILGIIGDTKKESNERSIEMYGNAIKNAVADYALKHPEDEEVTFDKLEKEKLIKYEGNKVECSTHEIYSDGNIWIKDCTVNDNLVEYEYGKEQEVKYKQVYKPQYYWYGTTGSNKVFKEFNEEKSQTTPEGHDDCYIGLDLDNSDKVKSVYLCFKKNGNEYCLKGEYTGEYTSVSDMNVSIIKDAVKATVNEGSSCSFIADINYYSCSVGSTSVSVDEDGYMTASSSISGDECDVDNDGSFFCY